MSGAASCSTCRTRRGRTRRRRRRCASCPSTTTSTSPTPTAAASSRTAAWPTLFAGSDGLLGSLLVDGFINAAWVIHRERDTATLHIHPLRPFSKEEEAEIGDEGAKLLAFAFADAGTHDVQFHPAP